MIKRIVVFVLCMSMNLLCVDKNIQDFFATVHALCITNKAIKNVCATNNDLIVALNIYWKLEHNKVCKVIKFVENKKNISRRIKQADISDSFIPRISNNEILAKARIEPGLSQSYKLPIVKNIGHR